jgi:CubicO group peptidase (beta-lactamase class C family)
MRRLTFAAVLSALVLTASAPAAPPVRSATAAASDAEARRFTADFDAFLATSMKRFPSIPGLSVAVARSRGPIFVAGYGMADRERHVPAGPHTGFYIASSTKSFVGLAFARLGQARKIDLDWTLAQLAPDIAFAPEVRAGEVTLRRLLSHSHGLVSEGIEFRLAYSGEHDPATLWRLLARVRANPKAPLGTFAYSNLGYNIAAMLIERKLGRPWQALLEEEVLRPARLGETFARGLAHNRVPLARPYAGTSPLYLAKTDAIMQSAGGLYSTAADMGGWIALQLAAEKGATGTPIPADSVRATHAPVVTLDETFGPFARTGYGLGWYSGPYRGATLYHSFGGYTGARAHASFMPARDLGVAVMVNDQDVGFPFADVAALYAYDWFELGPEAAARNAEEMIRHLEGQVERMRTGREADRARRASRSWTLSLAAAAYRGRFCNAGYGTLEVRGEGTALEARMGLLHAVLEPYTQPDSARLELIPGQGEVLQFLVEKGAVGGLRTMGADFRRC